MRSVDCLCVLLFCVFVCVLGFSEEEAKKRIYNVSCERYLGFGCEIDEETSTKLEGFFFVFYLLFQLVSLMC